MMIFIAIFVMSYIAFVALKYARGVLITTLTFVSTLTITNNYAGQAAMMLVLTAYPVLYIAGADAVEKLRSIKLTFAWLTLPRIEQPLIGDVDALPKPWL